MPVVAFAAACMPAHAEALNDLSSMPPVSVTMQPRVPLVAAAVLDEPPAGALDEVALADGAELLLLPHAARTTIPDTANAAVAHALCFTLTSTGPARHSAWPRIRPRLTRRLCLGRLRWEGDTRLSGLLVAESEPEHDGSPGLADIDPGLSRRVLVPSYKVPALQAGQILRGRRVLRGHVAWPCVVRPCVARCRYAGEFEGGGQPAARRLGQPGRAAVRGDQAVHDSQAEPGAVRVGGGEAQEGALPVLGAHARAVVGHGDPRPGRGRRRGHRDVATRAQRVERVGDEVVEHLLQVEIGRAHV